MKKLVFILACVSVCAMSCKPKTTEQDTQPQNGIESVAEPADMKICQSCGMPMTDDLFGNNADGSVNDEYCKYCYTAGAFTAPDITMNDMIETCVPFMVEQGMPEEEARNLLGVTLPKLKRWKSGNSNN